MRRASLWLIVLSVAGAGCGSSATSPSTTINTSLTQNFVGTLATSGNAFFSFAVDQSTTVSLTFASLVNTGSGAVLGSGLKLGLGIPAGVGCSLLTSTTATPALTAQVVAPLDPGTYCASLTDTAGLPASADFAIRITQGTPDLTANSSPETFASQVGPTGAATQTAVAPTAGIVTATLSSSTSNTTLGLGLGLWVTETSSCKVTQATVAGPGAQVSLPVDIGVYCVKIFDPATLPGFVSFSVTITHP